MKISSTTLGCPGWSLEQILEALKANGYDGIDFRGLGDEMEIWRLPEFTTDIERTRQRIAEAGLEVSGLSSGVHVLTESDEKRPRNAEEVAEYGKLCRQLGVGVIRIFGGRYGQRTEAQAAAEMVDQLRSYSDTVGPEVTLAIETHDDFCKTDVLGEVVETTARDNVRVLWDLHHPYRIGGETPEQTYGHIGRYTVGTHIKDSRKTAEKFEYTLAGEGDVPLAEMIRLLQDGGYAGWFTLEWEKKWKPELPGAEEALPSYAKFLRSFE
jgi:sugar phosphate isomerase/epimerase